MSLAVDTVDVFGAKVERKPLEVHSNVRK